MNGITVETVASSWIEALGGLSHRYMRSVPPGFCADAELATSTKAAASAAIPAGRWRTFSSVLGAPQGAPLWPGRGSIAFSRKFSLRFLGVLVSARLKAWYAMPCNRGRAWGVGRGERPIGS